MKADEKKCPRCAEAIKKDARVCRHCSYEFSDAEIAAQKAEEAKNKKLGCGLGLVVLLLVGYCSSQNGSGKQSTSSADATANAMEATADAMENAADELTAASAPVTPATKWSYSESTDEMRGTTSKMAAVNSDNEVDFDFPYNGGSTATLRLRRRPQDGLTITFSVSKGQILCNSYSNTHIEVKFDDGLIRSFGCTETNAGDSDLIFIDSEATFLKGLRASKKVMIEAQFYQAGGRQFTFDTRGLQWK